MTEEPTQEGYTQIGWISHGMNKVRVDSYKSMFGTGKVRVPPKIYKTAEIAKRYGTPVPVYVKND